jgi:hypothetical protein
MRRISLFFFLFFSFPYSRSFPFLHYWGLKFKALCLLDRHSTPWVTPPALVILELRVSLFTQAGLNLDPSILHFLGSLGWQVYTTMPIFFPLRWGLIGLELQSSWSQPPAQLGMTGTCHCGQLLAELGSWELFALVGLESLSSDPPDLSLPNS